MRIYAWSHARFTDHEPDGNYVPEALVATSMAALHFTIWKGRLEKFSGEIEAALFRSATAQPG